MTQSLSAHRKVGHRSKTAQDSHWNSLAHDATDARILALKEHSDIVDARRALPGIFAQHHGIIATCVGHALPSTNSRSTAVLAHAGV